jgi:hypothetical protein
LLGAQAPIPGSLGAALTHSARQGLSAALERLEQAGVRFEQRRVRLPLVARGAVPLSAAQALEYIKGQGPDICRLQAILPGAPVPFAVKELGDLRTLDGVYGAGLSVVPPDQAGILGALAGLRQNGFKICSGHYYDQDSNRDAPLVEHFRDLSRSWNLTIEKRGHYHQVRSPEQLMALDYFEGSGNDRGLKSSVLAGRLREVARRGMKFYVAGREITPYDLYYFGCSGHTLQVDRGAGLFPSVSDEDLADPARLEDRLEEAERVYQRILQPAFAGQVDEKRAGAEAMAVLFPEDPFPLEQRAAVYAELIKAACASGNRDPFKDVAQVYTALRQSSSSAYELACKALMVCEPFRQGGARRALASLEQVAGSLRSGAFGAGAQAELQELFFRLLKASSSASAALEGIDLVRIPAGSESLQERVKLFCDIAARESESTLAQTAVHYRGVLVHRAPDETLASAGGRFLRLLQGMTVGRHQDRVVEIFASIQEGLRAGRYPAHRADEMVEAFLAALAVSGDVERARQALMGSSEAPTGKIEDTEEAIVIGGVAIPRKG